MFSNRGIAQELVRALNELGYTVDVIDWQRREFVPKRRYDLFVGHGGINFTSIARDLPPEVPKVFLATGVRWDVWNRACADRVSGFTNRHGWFVPVERTIRDDEERALDCADAIICIGNERAADTYRVDGKPVAALENAVFINERPLPDRDWESARRDILFFSGGDPLLKGLDLLLDGIRDLGLTCHVCQRPSAAFDLIYERLGAGQTQVIRHGYVPAQTPRFYQITARCGFVVAPSAAEGQPGGLLECIATGLIPIATPDVNLDISDFGFTLDSARPETVESVLRAATALPSPTLARMSGVGAERIRSRHNPQAFRRAARDGIAVILNRLEGGGR